MHNYELPLKLDWLYLRGVKFLSRPQREGSRVVEGMYASHPLSELGIWGWGLDEELLLANREVRGLTGVA